MQVDSCAGGSPQELEPQLTGGAGEEGATAGRCERHYLLQTADKRMLAVLKEASSQVSSFPSPNSLREGREERMAAKGIQILPPTNPEGQL